VPQQRAKDNEFAQADVAVGIISVKLFELKENAKRVPYFLVAFCRKDFARTSPDVSANGLPTRAVGEKMVVMGMLLNPSESNFATMSVKFLQNCPFSHKRCLHADAFLTSLLATTSTSSPIARPATRLGDNSLRKAWVYCQITASSAPSHVIGTPTSTDASVSSSRVCKCARAVLLPSLDHEDFQT